MDIYVKLKEHGITLDETPIGGRTMAPMVEFSDRLVYVSGTNCRKDGVILHPGKVGAEVMLEQAQLAARQSMLNIISKLHICLGDLNCIGRFVKVLGFVASAPDFFEQPEVMDEASQLLIDLFGNEIGFAARSAIGVSVLPHNMPVEIELLLELKKQNGY